MNAIVKKSTVSIVSDTLNSQLYPNRDTLLVRGIKRIVVGGNMLIAAGILYAKHGLFLK